MENLNLPPTLKINMLGSFSVSLGNIVLSDSSPRASQVWKLFKYMITNRSAPIPTEKLIDMLWPEEEVDNPIKALYSLIYRLRTILNKYGPDKQDFILFQHNSYQWNRNAPFQLDALDFERCYTQASQKDKDPSVRIALYQQAFDLYQGDYLAESAQESWVLPFTNYYKRLYTSVVLNLSHLCEAVQDYASVVKYCEKAIELDPYEEAHHIALISALIHLGQISQALAHYDYISSVLYKDLGVQPSEKLQALYKEIYRSTEEVQYNLRTIKESLNETGPQITGAFFCELNVFRQIYQLERRALVRSGQVVYLACLSITTLSRKIPNGEMLSTVIPLLKRKILLGLRRGDVITQYSKSQILLLLSSATYEDCERVLERLERAFLSAYSGEPLRLHHALEPITAI